jgi:hypothetical protein
MPAYLICETCLHLWVEYGAATTKMRAITRNQSLIREATEARKAVAQAILAHEAMAHPFTYAATINWSADKAIATGA